MNISSTVYKYPTLEEYCEILILILFETILHFRPRYHVVHIASEMAPVAKVGGLGDVVAGLGRSIQNRGHRVEVIIPKYKCMDITGIKNFKVICHMG